ncbi:MAG TPA: hypothetical protein VM925_36735, partial [Labilithrix sp.]|nr:hypothetical protein [Labilithrix sp.]
MMMSKRRAPDPAAPGVSAAAPLPFVSHSPTAAISTEVAPSSDVEAEAISTEVAPSSDVEAGAEVPVQLAARSDVHLAAGSELELPVPSHGDAAAVLAAAAAAIGRGASGAMATVLERHGSAPGTPG